MPILPEWNQLKRAMARELLQMVAPDFDGPERYIEGLNAERLERLGTCLIVLLDPSKQQLPNCLNNPAGFVRSIMVDDYWLHTNAGSMSYVWEGLWQWFARCCWSASPRMCSWTGLMKKSFTPTF